MHSWGENVGEEARKNYSRWLDGGFYARYLSGENVLDIGYSGYLDGVKPITPSAIGVGLDYPGYDGKTLPFGDDSQDAVFASHCLEHIDDYRSAIREWFRVVRVGGHLVVSVPHQYLYERRLHLPSQFNADHRRFYTAASLLSEVEEAVDPIHFRVRHLEDNDRGFDYSIPPDRHAVGSYEILLVIEKIARPGYADLVSAEPEITTASDGVFMMIPKPGNDRPVVAVSSTAPPQSVIVFKMDHLGDFIAAEPAMSDLRTAFPEAHLTLVCGSWNVGAAKELGVFDEVIEFSLFARYSPLNGTIDLETSVEELHRLVRDREFDLALDLRVDPDTRSVLKHVNARVRAGFGTKQSFPWLDIALPMISPTARGSARKDYFGARQFQSRVGVNHGHSLEIPPGVYESDNTIVWGPYCGIPEGTYIVTLHLEGAEGTIPPFDYDIVCRGGNDRLASGPGNEIAGVGVVLTLNSPIQDLEVRIWGRGVSSTRATLRGCTIVKFGEIGGPHQTELMAMLVALTRHRVCFLQTEERIA